jgi:hypothetical protein
MSKEEVVKDEKWGEKIEIKMWIDIDNISYCE